MRTLWTAWGLMVAVETAALLVSGSTARAEDGPERAPASWRFHVRVVRLSVQAPTVEQAPVLPGTTPSGIVSAPWAEVLAALKPRGTLQILLDRSATALPGRELKVAQIQTEMVMVPERADSSNSTTKAQPYASRAEAAINVVSDAASLLDYAVTVDWVKASPQRTSPISLQARWQGSQTVEGDGTLVLRHAEQDGLGGGTEIYVLITWDAP